MLPMEMKDFRLEIPEISFGNGSISGIGKRLGGLGYKNALIVTDKGLMQTDIVDKIKNILLAEAIACNIFAEVEPEPSLKNVEAGLVFARKHQPDVILGLGGGSPMDVSKMIAILLKHGGAIKNYVGIDNVPGRGVPTISIPTTAGTGSEVSKYGIFDGKEAKTKLGVGSRHLIPDFAIVDPELTFSMPPHITAATGCDAFIHAIEGYLAVRATPISDFLSLEAVRLIYHNLPSAFSDGTNTEARYQMLYGSLLAGICLNLAGCSSCHALSYPIASEYHVSHGVGCMLTFIEVLRYFAPASPEKFVRIAEEIGVDTTGKCKEIIAQEAIDLISTMVEQLNIPHKLSTIGVEKDRFMPYAQSVVANQQRLIGNGPRQLSEEDIVKIYELSY